MKHITYSFRHAEVILNEPAFKPQYTEVINIISSISDEDIIARHEGYGKGNIERTPKSISKAINELLKNRFAALEWNPESPIFKDNDYQGDNWRLDFAKKDISIEVAFNHSSVIAWNLIKPVLASELNHVQKAIQTRIGIVITATENLKSVGGFDSAIGTYEKYIKYLKPLGGILTSPILIIGLIPPETFDISKEQYADRKKIGRIRKIQ